MECAALDTAAHLRAKTALRQPDTIGPHSAKYITRRCISDAVISDGTVGEDNDPGGGRWQEGKGRWKKGGRKVEEGGGRWRKVVGR